ncbi:hypothetical protein NPIL_250851 [Nephila pilipes]|uniref:Uncharacterized protein n=1 Tax=Nephila pilipes TaxID=299642 RepID=A0A8X6TZX5_NEPPI|nr:hypothetical protein NPIL_250851 [Nephila pilipes]
MTSQHRYQRQQWNCFPAKRTTEWHRIVFSDEVCLCFSSHNHHARVRFYVDTIRQQLGSAPHATMRHRGSRRNCILFHVYPSSHSGHYDGQRYMADVMGQSPSIRRRPGPISAR